MGRAPPSVQRTVGRAVLPGRCLLVVCRLRRAGGVSPLLLRKSVIAQGNRGLTPPARRVRPLSCVPQKDFSLPLTCPVCRAANDQGPACRRCRADLSLLFVLDAQRQARLAAATTAAAQGRLDSAAHYAEQ